MALKTMTEVQEELGISRPTLIRHVRRARLQVHFDPHDYRKKLLDDGQVAQLREVVARMSKRRES